MKEMVLKYTQPQLYILGQIYAAPFARIHIINFVLLPHKLWAILIGLLICIYHLRMPIIFLDTLVLDAYLKESISNLIPFSTSRQSKALKFRHLNLSN